MRAISTLPAILLLLLLGGAIGCTKPPPPKPPPKPLPPPPKPLTTAEMQTNVTGAARLNKGCLTKKAETGVYVIRLLIDPSGRVSQVAPRQAPERSADPSVYSGVARYINAGKEADNEVTRCYAAVFRKLRFRKFGGPTVGFDYPVVVERLPPSEAGGKERACESDDDCVFRQRSACKCPLCGKTWRRAINKKAAKKLKKKATKAAKKAKKDKKKVSVRVASIPTTPRGVRVRLRS